MLWLDASYWLVEIGENNQKVEKSLDQVTAVVLGDTIYSFADDAVVF